MRAYAIAYGTIVTRCVYKLYSRNYYSIDGTCFVFLCAYVNNFYFCRFQFLIESIVIVAVTGYGADEDIGDLQDLGSDIEQQFLELSNLEDSVFIGE